MKRFKIIAHVNSVRTEAIICANTSIDARKLFEAQYAACKITYVSVTPI